MRKNQGWGAGDFREPAPKVIEPEPGSGSRSSKITAPHGYDSPPLGRMNAKILLLIKKTSREKFIGLKKTDYRNLIFMKKIGGGKNIEKQYHH